eukprot:scaffold827_cov369-Prasinococcus_capsulatus_cf.AAC.28
MAPTLTRRDDNGAPPRLSARAGRWCASGAARRGAAQGRTMGSGGRTSSHTWAPTRARPGDASARRGRWTARAPGTCARAARRSTRRRGRRQSPSSRSRSARRGRAAPPLHREHPPQGGARGGRATCRRRGLLRGCAPAATHEAGPAWSRGRKQVPPAVRRRDAPCSAATARSPRGCQRRADGWTVVRPATCRRRRGC